MNYKKRACGFQSSQIDVKPIRDFDAFIGQTLDFKVVKVNQLRKNILYSLKYWKDYSRISQKEEQYDALHSHHIHDYQ